MNFRIFLEARERPYWLDSYLANGHKVNRGGTVDLYHATSTDNAQEMVRTQKMISPADAPDAYGVYLSTSSKVGDKVQGGGYGVATVRVTVRIQDLVLDDEFPDGRMDFYIQTIRNEYRPVRITLA